MGQVFVEYFGFSCQSFHRLPLTLYPSSGSGTTGQIVADIPSGLRLTPPQNYVARVRKGRIAYYLVNHHVTSHVVFVLVSAVRYVVLQPIISLAWKFVLLSAFFTLKTWVLRKSSLIFGQNVMSERTVGHGQTVLLEEQCSGWSDICSELLCSRSWQKNLWKMELQYFRTLFEFPQFHNGSAFDLSRGVLQRWL
jgi:hypothetical protein